MSMQLKRIALCALLFLEWLPIHAYSSAEEKPWIVKEEFLSPATGHFDCHSSSLVETGEGTLCAVWKGGAGEGKSNLDMKKGVGIWSSRFDGTAWSKPTEIVSAASSVCWNPVVCRHPSGTLFLFYRIGPTPRQTVSFVKKSQDGGVSWSEAEVLPAGITGPTKNKPLVTEEGVLICPSCVSVGEPEDRFKATACWIDISEDQGLHWRKVGPFSLPHRPFGVIEPALFWDTQGCLRMLCRDRAHKGGEVGFIWEAISEDGGEHWSPLRQTVLPNPDSAFDVVELGEGKLMLVYNHSHTDRFPLHLAISTDGGEHWSLPLVLDERGEFPAAVATSDGQVHITYAFPVAPAGQRRIKHVVISPQGISASRDAICRD